MNIAMMHFRVGMTDGVSLEMDKWRHVLESMGHRVIYIAGQSANSDARIIEELSIDHETRRMLSKNAFEKMTDFSSDEALLDAIFREATIISDKLATILSEERIELVIPNNITSLGLNLSAGIAMHDVIERLQLRAIHHHHDFHWERVRYSRPTTPLVRDILDRYFPDPVHKARHVVISLLAKQSLKTKTGLDADIIGNVMDYDAKPWVKDAYNDDIRRVLGIPEDDIVFLQATRVEDRKAIELAIDVTERFDSALSSLAGKTLYNGTVITERTRAHLLVAGINDMHPDKHAVLMSKVKSTTSDVRFINDMVASERSSDPTRKTYSLWDIYTASDIVTYPSLLEGFGNQFLEAVFARKPLVVYEYPVYMTDIGPLGFDVITLGNKHLKRPDGMATVSPDILERATEQIILTLTDPVRHDAVVSRNFDIAAGHFSYKTLEAALNYIIENNDNPT
jgi:mannosylglucosylglycerate synthase